MNYDSVIFDLDGTLWNSTKQIHLAWQRIFDKHGLPKTSYEEIMSVMGLSDIILIQTLFPHLNDEEALELFNECTVSEFEYLREVNGVPYEGIFELLETLSKKLPLCIVSNCDSGYIEIYMETMGTRKFITDFLSFGDTGRPKSENIKTVVERNGFKNPVYVGDTQWDMDSATSAGVPFIYATYGFGDFECDFPRIEKPLDLIKIL